MIRELDRPEKVTVENNSSMSYGLTTISTVYDYLFREKEPEETQEQSD